jgi:hypothetical protein
MDRRLRLIYNAAPCRRTKTRNEGARLDGTDFYLVDLRGALFDPDQEPHLRRCKAIL